MQTGPGKYDQENTELRERLKARGLLIIVLDGNRGNGISFQCERNLLFSGAQQMVAQALRDLAEELENDPCVAMEPSTVVL